MARRWLGAACRGSCRGAVHPCARRTVSRCLHRLVWMILTPMGDLPAAIERLETLFSKVARERRRKAKYTIK